MAIPVERIHIIRKTLPTAKGSPQAIKSLENMRVIIKVNSSQRNQLDLKTGKMGFFRLTKDKNRSWKAPIGQSHPQ